MTKQQAYERLRELTGEDFGDDVEAWERWYKKNKKLLIEAIRVWITKG